MISLSDITARYLAEERTSRNNLSSAAFLTWIFSDGHKG